MILRLVLAPCTQLPLGLTCTTFVLNCSSFDFFKTLNLTTHLIKKLSKMQAHQHLPRHLPRRSSDDLTAGAANHLGWSRSHRFNLKQKSGMTLGWGAHIREAIHRFCYRGPRPISTPSPMLDSCLPSPPSLNGVHQCMP